MFRIIVLFMVFFLTFNTTNLYAEQTLKMLDGEKITLSSLKGKWIFVNFWASWCHPCIDEIAEFNRFYKRYKAQDVAVFAINYDRLPAYKQQELVKQFHIHYPSLTRHAATILHLGHVSVVPVTYVFNPQGQLVDTLYGGQTQTSLREAMHQA